MAHTSQDAETDHVRILRQDDGQDKTKTHKALDSAINVMLRMCVHPQTVTGIPKSD